MKILAELHGGGDPSNQRLKHLIRLILNVEERIISIEMSACLLLHINTMCEKYNMIFPIFIERQMRPQYIYSVARSLMCARISNPPVAS